MDFYVSKFQMNRPKYYISVFLLPSENKYLKFAERYHGTKLNPYSIGYSYFDDLSIVAIIPRAIYGSLQHELFHTLARSNFGDIPTWLDEGIAALYESSELRKDGIYGLDNWRGAILGYFSDYVPNLNDLITGRTLGIRDSNELPPQSYDSWETYCAFGSEEEVFGECKAFVGELSPLRQAVFAATARYFALFLQEQNLLFSTYSAVRDLVSSDHFSGRSADLVGAVEQAAGRSIDRLEADFTAWLETKHKPDEDVAQ